MRTVLALLGLAVMMAVFAGIELNMQDTDERTGGGPAFQLGPDEVRSIAIQPSLPGETIQVTVTVRGGTIDVYTMDSTWSAHLVEHGLDLRRPFAYHAQYSRIGVDDQFTFDIVSDGETWHDLLLDNVDNHYDNDSVPGADVVTVDVNTRFLAEEDNTIVLGYLATIPSILLVVVTVWRKLRRWRAERADAKIAEHA